MTGLVQLFLVSTALIQDVYTSRFLGIQQAALHKGQAESKQALG